MWGSFRRGGGLHGVIMRSKNKNWEMRGGGVVTLSYSQKQATNGPNSHSSMICEGWKVTPQFSVPALNPRTLQHSYIFSPSFSCFLCSLTQFSIFASRSPQDHRMIHWVQKHRYYIHGYTAAWLITFSIWIWCLQPLAFLNESSFKKAQNGTITLGVAKSQKCAFLSIGLIEGR